MQRQDLHRQARPPRRRAPEWKRIESRVYFLGAPRKYFTIITIASDTTRGTMRARRPALALVVRALLVTAVFVNAGADDKETSTFSPSDTPDEQTQTQQRNPRPVFVDDCDACAAAGYALFDSLSYQQTLMRAKLGSDTRLADTSDYEKYAVNAVESACAKRGHWLRFAMRSVLDPVSRNEFLVLSGPGMDADAAPGITRPDDEGGVIELSNVLRARCVEEAHRVDSGFLVQLFNDTDVEIEKDDDDDDVAIESDDHSPNSDHQFNENSAAFAYALCVDRKRAKKGKVKAPPCQESKIRQKASSVMAAVNYETETVEKYLSAKDLEKSDEDNEIESLLMLTETCVSEMPRLSTITRTAAQGSVSTSNDPSFGLSTSDSSLSRKCLTASSAATKRGDHSARAASAALSAKDSKRFEEMLRDALLWYAKAEQSAPEGSPEAVTAAVRAARSLVAEHPGFNHEGMGLENFDEDEEQYSGESSTEGLYAYSLYGYDSVSFRSKDSRLKVATLAARRASRSRQFDPTPRLVLADLYAASGDPEAAFDEYTEALYHLPYHGEMSAQVTTRAGGTASAAAHRLAGFSVTMERALHEDEGDLNGDTSDTGVHLSPSRIEEIQSALSSAKAMAVARAKEAAMNCVEALVMVPTRRRHANLAAATLAHAAATDGRWNDALNAANIADRCDEQRPPEECHAVFLAHAKGLMDMDLWALAREGAHLAVSARGEKGREVRDAWALATEAERKMDTIADERFMEKLLGKDWKKLVRGDPQEGEWDRVEL